MSGFGVTVRIIFRNAEISRLTDESVDRKRFSSECGLQNGFQINLVLLEGRCL